MGDVRGKMVPLAVAVALLAFCVVDAMPQNAAKSAAQAGPAALRALQTRAERTKYEETSRYQDVMDFMRAVAAEAPLIHLTTYGYTFEGRALPLAVIGATDASPEAVKATGKTRIYIQGNIHAGEVEGKEACLEILRDIALGRHADWLNSAVLMINPIYNADGNEKINLTNRGTQNGPLGGMGQRPNGQNYDLNRDFMKLDAPESRSFEMLMSRYDPHLMVDLHTTDGSVHAYQITYAPPLHPLTANGIVDLLRKGLLPDVTKAIKTKDDMDIYYYGNLPRGGMPPGGRGGMPGGGRGEMGAGRGGAPTERVFSTTEPTARYGVNMVGLRNRFAILSETFAYLTFQERIKAARRFVEEICNYVMRHGAEIRKATADADRESIAGKEVGLRGKLVRSAEMVDILIGEVATEKNPYTGARILRRLDVRKPDKMYEATSWEASETTIAPKTYFVPTTRYAQDRLEAHGIAFTRLEQPLSIKGEQFKIESSTVSEREYEGHKARTITGKWEPADLTVPAGILVVSVDQPLGRLALMLLEPRSEDCLACWGLMEDVMAQNPQTFPILRSSLPASGK